jgi:large subunit ribosomal protein L18
MNNKLINRKIRKNRVRAKVSGTAETPRLSVSVTLKHITAQLIDDQAGKTLCSAGDLKITGKTTKSKKAEQVGTEIAEKAKALKIKSVVFDRGFKLYHGRIKSLADAARKAGLVF